MILSKVNLDRRIDNMHKKSFRLLAAFFLFLIILNSSLPVALATSLSLVYPTGNDNLSRGVIGDHIAWDFIANSSTTIKAAASGRVHKVYSGCKNYNGLKNRTCISLGCPGGNFYNGFCNYGNGNGVILEHVVGGTKYYTTYSHLSSFEPGILDRSIKTVTVGAPLGKAGSTGQSTGEHLHFALQKDTSASAFLDPGPYFPAPSLDSLASDIGVKDLTETNATIYAWLKTSQNVSTVGCWFGTDKDNLKKYTESINGKVTGISYGANKWFGGLNPGTTYYYKLYITRNSQEITSDIKSFTTPGKNPSPTVTSPPAPAENQFDALAENVGVRDLTETNATIFARFKNEQRVSAIGCWFGTDKNNLKRYDENYAGNVKEVWYGANKWFGALKPGTTYYYKFYITVGGEELVSSLRSFTTPAAQGVRFDNLLENIGVRKLSETEAEIFARFKNEQKVSTIGCWFGTDKNNLKRYNETINGGVIEMWYGAQKWFGGVKPGTAYYYKFYITIGGEELVSSLRSFNTPSSGIYTVSFDPAGGSVSPQSKTVNAGGAYGDLPVPTREGYNFAGWYTAKEGGTKVTAESAVNINAPQTLYARWQEPLQDLVLDAGQEAVLSAVQAAAAMAARVIAGLTDPIVWKSDNTDVLAVDPSGVVRGISPGIANLVATAGEKGPVLTQQTVKVAATTYTVTFDALEGSVEPKSKAVNSGETYGTLPAPTKAGFQFLGWYTAKEGGTKVLPETKVEITADHTLYARWKQIIPGDANDDKVVDIADLPSIINYLVQSNPCPSMENANADGKGEVDMADLIWIISTIVNK